MRIAYISSAFLADCDLPLIKEITSEGHEVVYILQMSDHTRQATVVNVERMKPKGGVYPASEYKGLEFMADYLPLENVYVQNMPSCHEWHLQSLLSVWKLFCFLRKGKFDVVHLTWPPRYSTFPLYAFRRKMVLTMHDPLPHSSDRNRLNEFHRTMAFRLISHFIVLSKMLREEFVATYHLEQKHVHLSRLGCYEIMKTSKGIDMPLPKRYILFAGSIHPHKGIRYLCEAMKTISKEQSDLSLVISGRGQFDFDIDAYCQELPIQVFNRFVLHDELYTLIKNAELVVCPYLDATQSGVLMSAFALDKPVVCTNVGALPEMVQDGRHGLLVPPRDSAAIARAVLQLLDGGRLTEIADNIHADYTSGQRSWKAIAQETIDVYRQVAQRH